MSYINTTATSGPISVGSAQGVGKSLNYVRNFRSGTTQNIETNLNTNIRNFFTSLVSNDTVTSSPSSISFSQCRGGIVWKATISLFNNCGSNGTYHNLNNGRLDLKVEGGGASTISLTLGSFATQTISSGGTASWTTLAGTYLTNTRGDYNLTLRDNSTSVDFSLLVRCYETTYGTNYVTYNSVSYNVNNFFWNL